MSPVLSVMTSRRAITLIGIVFTLIVLLSLAYNFSTIRLHTRATRPILNKVTSLKYVNPDNAPDAWETLALRSFEQGGDEASELTTIGDQPYMRLIKPMITEKGCLACHAAQQYQLGDVRGALSIGVPMQSYLEQMARERRSALTSHLFIWVIGLCSFGALGILTTRAERAVNDWAATFDAMHDCILIIDPEERILRCNAATVRFFGKAENQLLGHRCRDLMHGDRIPDACPVARSLVGKKSEAAVLELQGKPCQVAADPILDASGNVVKIVHTIRDITELRKLEMHLYQAQKMEAVGTLAGGVAHDFNNILSAIVGYASLLEIKTPPQDPRRQYVENILASTERAAGLTRSLLSFGRKQPTALKPVLLNEIVSGFQKILARLIGEDIAFTNNLFPGDLVVEADQGQLEQVLMNLATNARDAMPRGGQLQISTDRAVFDRDSGEIARGSYAVVAVSDSGHGMDQQTQEHLFEPFFTTKEVGKGTGLGLAIVYGIVKKHNGVIHVYSEQGSGTTFKIFIPLSLAATTRDQPPTAPAALPVGSQDDLHERLRARAHRGEGAAGSRHALPRETAQPDRTDRHDPHRARQLSRLPRRNDAAGQVIGFGLCLAPQVRTGRDYGPNPPSTPPPRSGPVVLAGVAARAAAASSSAIRRRAARRCHLSLTVPGSAARKLASAPAATEIRITAASELWKVQVKKLSAVGELFWRAKLTARIAMASEANNSGCMCHSSLALTRLWTWLHYDRKIVPHRTALSAAADKPRHARRPRHWCPPFLI